MTFFKRKRKSLGKETYLANELYVLKTVVTSNYNDGSGFGPRCVTVYLLARQENNVYYELFTDKKIQRESDMHSDGAICLTFNVPYIEEVKPITEYSDKKKFEKSLLFDFIMEMNVLNSLGAFEEEEEEMSE